MKTKEKEAMKARLMRSCLAMHNRVHPESQKHECQWCGEVVDEIDEEGACEECASLCLGCGAPLDNDWDEGSTFCLRCR